MVFRNCRRSIGKRSATPSVWQCPGCYASGFVSLVYPMVHSGLLPKDYPVQCFAMSGYSGGGKKMIAEIESPDRAPELYSPRFYGLANNHKHLPEMRRSPVWKRSPCSPRL